MPSKGLLVTFALTYGGSLVALFNPFVGLLIYICFSIIRPEDMWSYAVPRGNYSRIVGVALLVGWVDNNTYAVTAVAAIGLAFFLGVHSASLWGKLIAFALGGLLINSIMFSFSRGGVLSLAVTAGVIFLIIPKRPLYFLIFVVAV